MYINCLHIHYYFIYLDSPSLSSQSVVVVTAAVCAVLGIVIALAFLIV